MAKHHITLLTGLALSVLGKSYSQQRHFTLRQPDWPNKEAGSLHRKCVTAQPAGTMWSLLSSADNFILSPLFSFSKWVDPPLPSMKYGSYYVVHVLQNFVDEVAGHWDPISLPAV